MERKKGRIERKEERKRGKNKLPLGPILTMYVIIRG